MDYKTHFAHMYECLSPIEKKIAALRLESINDPAQIDKLLEEKKITPYTASFYKERISERLDAQSTFTRRF